MAVNSRAKGKRYERKIAKIFETWAKTAGVDLTVRSTPLSGGWYQSGKYGVAGDLVATDAKFPFGVECKSREGWSLEQMLSNAKCPIFAWREQNVRECPAGKIPLLIFTKRLVPDYVMIGLQDYVNLFTTTHKPVPKPAFHFFGANTGTVYILELATLLAAVPYPSTQETL